MNRFGASFELAEGFYELGLYVDAWEELDKLPVEVQADPDILSFRLNVLLALNRWDDAVALGAGCCRAFPSRDEFILRTADALVRLTDYEKALALLKGAPATLRAQAESHYMLAGLVEDAKKALHDCFKKDKFHRQRALDDPDLTAVWDALG
jgi:predicted Zn-dependent protease